jgi:hypothetical protein
MQTGQEQQVEGKQQQQQQEEEEEVGTLCAASMLFLVRCSLIAGHALHTFIWLSSAESYQVCVI